MILVGATIPPFAATSEEDRDWLASAEDMREFTLEATGQEVKYFAALELDSRGYEPFDKTIDRLDDVQADYWSFTLNDSTTTRTTGNRLIHICTGRNLIEEYAMRQPDCSHILFLDADLLVPADSIVKLLEVNMPLAGGDVPSYCLNGPWDEEIVNANGEICCQIHWNTAGFLMVTRDVFRQIKWRTDHYDAGLTDDPCFAHDAKVWGFPETRVRKDVVGTHRPLVPLEERGHDLKVY